MDNLIQNEAGGHRSKIKLIIIIALIVVAIVIAGYFAFTHLTKNQSPTTSQEPLVIPAKILENKFGWLGGGAEDDGLAVTEGGGAWVRPHPGSFLWDAMQSSSNAKLDFSQTDQEIKNYQKNGLGILVTLWPFADWDQQASATASDCAVSDNDEFLSKNDKKGRGSYLPKYRCNPIDWTKYQTWVTATVERYDGDGIDDMPGLQIPIKHWEVMNEPDLRYNSTISQEETSSLTFYKQGPLDYGTLLEKTYNSIKSADSESKVLIAGAAGGGDFLNFYDLLFSKMASASNYFDIGNIHCISNDQQSHDFNVGEYKTMLSKFSMAAKPIWVTEAEAFYQKNTTADQNYESTKTSVQGAITAGAERIFFTRYSFDDFRTDMSQKTSASQYPSVDKYRDITESY